MTVRTLPDLGNAGYLFGISLLVCFPMGLRAIAQDEADREVAELRNGQRVTGNLVEDADGSLGFQAGSGSPEIALDQIAQVLRQDPESPPQGPVEPQPFLLSIGFDQRLSGRLIAMDEETIRFAPGQDLEPLSIERRGVSSMIQRPGEAQVFADRFEEPEPNDRWSLEQGSTIAPRGDNAGAALTLESGTSEARLRLPEPVDAGRVEFSFFWEGRQIAGHQWVVDLIFDAPKDEELTRIVLGWKYEFPSVESRGGPNLVVQPLVLEPGWYRLTARFGPGRTLLSVDGKDLARGGGPRGALSSIRVRTEHSRDADRSEELTARIDDLLVIRSFEPSTHPEIDPTQDELRMVQGDQIWGSVASADDQGVRMDVLGRPFEASWSQVAGLYFERKQSPAGPIEGQWVRAEWDVGDPNSEPDRLEGVLTGVAPDGFRIEAPYVGTLIVPRDQLRSLRFLGAGRRLVLDSYPRHLGDQIMPELDPPMPDGDTFDVSFSIDELPEGPANLLIDAVHVEGDLQSGRFAEELRDGYQRTNLLLNGEVFDFLNQHVRDANRTPALLRVPIPRDRLKEGENLLRFEQLGRESDPNYRDDLGLLRIVLEWPTPGQRASD